MVKLLKIPSEPLNLFSHQHCYISNSLSTEFNKWALFPYNSNLKCLCKIIPVSDISHQFYYVKSSVLHYSVYSDLYSHSTADPYEFMDTEEIKILPLTRANNIEVSVVFENVIDSFSWKNNLYYLQTIIKNILILFTVVRNCIINIHRMKEVPNNGIYCIIVHNTGNKKCACDITKNTTIVVKDVMSLIKFKATCSVQNKNNTSILTSQIDFLQKFINAHIINSFSARKKLSNKILLIGPSGSGKSLLINSIVGNMKLLLLTVEMSQLIISAHHKPRENLTSCFRQASLLAKENQNGICVILLKNIEYICPKMSKKFHSYNKRLTTELRHILDNNIYQDGLIVIATTSNIHLLDPTFRRANRLEVEIYIGVLSECERQTILKLFFEKAGLNKQICQQVAAVTSGYLVSDLAFIVQEIARLQLKRNFDENTTLMSMFRNFIRKYRPTSFRSSCIISRSRILSMNNLGGMESIKTTLKSYVEWPLKYPKKFFNFGVPIPKGILLYGPPGCAKTSLVCALANSLNVTFLSISAAELYSPYVGVTEQNVNELFNKARINSPSLLFIDEIDALVGNRETLNNDVRQNVLSSFLTELDGIGNRIGITHGRNIFADDNNDNSKIVSSATVIVIAATNRPDKLDPAILRPGRFDKLLYVDLPNDEDRLKILQTIISNWKMPINSCVDLVRIAEETPFYSGADLTNLVREAGFEALSMSEKDAECVKQEHFLAALKSVSSSVNQQKIEFYKKINLCNFYI